MHHNVREHFSERATELHAMRARQACEPASKACAVDPGPGLLWTSAEVGTAGQSIAVASVTVEAQLRHVAYHCLKLPL